MYRLRFFTAVFLVATFSNAHTQTLGGNTAYNFLKLPYSTSITAGGGVNISHDAQNVSAAFNNPALLTPSLHTQLALSFTQLAAGIKSYTLAGAHYSHTLNTTFGVNLFFIDYGTFDAADAAGNRNGTFRATDYVVQFSAGRQYLERWQYGGSVKFIQSSYAPYNSSAVAVDVGVRYIDSANGVSIAMLAKNMGAQLKSYAGEREELPFDLQFGITKKLAKAPLAFSATIQQAHRFNLFYRDTTFNAENGGTISGSFANKLLQHVVFATHIFISSQLEATVGYNHLRRSELSLGTPGNGLSGFSAGFVARFEKLHISYARSTYQKGIAYNQLGLNLMLGKLFSAGTF